MNKIQMVDLKGQYIKIKAEVDAGIQEVINNAQFIKGPQIKVFEENGLKSAKVLTKILKNSEEFLAATLIGTNICIVIIYIFIKNFCIIGILFTIPRSENPYFLISRH